jgi:flagellar motor protein MotB
LFFVDTRAYKATLISLFSRPSNICLLALKSQALSIVDGIAAKLMEIPYNVRVEGHTDDIPIKTAQFPSNWELSTSRATHVLKHLIQSGGIPPSLRTELVTVGV